MDQTAASGLDLKATPPFGNSARVSLSEVLAAEERAAIEKHPLFTWEILSRVTAFRDFAWMSALHHEKLDGSGYPWKLTAESLDTPARILAVADIYDALTADRPYREGMSREKALRILGEDRDTRLFGEAIDALAACTQE